ncbi:hypothetical protein ACFWJT_28170 [Streptomyces sp. NPDC127069]|uniref:hypothetical protein n=1 Tax=Streptomyces sp. NPDC127069 TaxID=3347128 RepID=UPI0036558055
MIMRRTAVTLTGLAFFTAALVGGCGTAASGPGAPAPLPPSGPAAACPVLDRAAHTAPPATVGGTPVNTPEAARLSQAVGAQGRGAFADVYGAQITDHPAGRVALCVTDLGRGRLLLEAARKADPAVDPGRADLYLSRYTRRALNEGVARLTADQGRPLFPLYSFSPAPDASGIVVTSTAEGAASKDLKARLERLTGGIPVTVERGDPLTPAVGGPSADAGDPAP